MEKFWEKAQIGDVDYFKCLDATALEGVFKAKDEDDRSVLHVATAAGHAELVQLLSSKGQQEWLNQPDDEVGRLSGRW